jgi:hypothetical protein
VLKDVDSVAEEHIWHGRRSVADNHQATEKCVFAVVVLWIASLVKK